MALNELIETFETLKKLIEEHGDYLSGGGGAETRTRQVLIDPLLKELGWDVGDPRTVELEHPIEKPFATKGYQRADYVLLDEYKKPLAIVEAKRLDEGLHDALTQAAFYAFNKNIRWVVVTDGDDWELYDAFDRDRQLPDNLLVKFSVSSQPSSTCALKALALWRRNVCANDGPVGAEKPVVQPLDNGNGGCDDRDWRELSKKMPTDGRRSAVRYNGNEEKVTSWATMHQAIGKLMVKNGDLTRTKVPLKKGKAILVNDGETGIAKPMKIGDGMYVNGVGFAKSLINRSVALCEAVGIDPASVEVCFE